MNFGGQPRAISPSTLEALPESSVQAVSVERTNFLPPARDANDQRPFHQRQVLRERISRNSLGEPLTPQADPPRRSERHGE